ncbi:MAG: response regulator [Wolinella sp.]
MTKRVVIVDDSKTIVATAQMVVEEMVERGEIEFVSYYNPEELLKDAQEGRLNYDLLISDINMPQMSGLDLSEALKKLENLRNKPILVLTTESSAEMKSRGKAIGVTGWMVKPFEALKLTKSIRMLLGI